MSDDIHRGTEELCRRGCCGKLDKLCQAVREMREDARAFHAMHNGSCGDSNRATAARAVERIDELMKKHEIKE